MRMLIRRIEPRDNPAVARIIRLVMQEMGASAPGFAIHDQEVDAMYESYQGPRAAYYVLEKNGQVTGGGGIAPLKGGDAATCELKKMYFLPQARGGGFGRILLDECLSAARQSGYRECYIETFHTMVTAILLYEKFGFERIAGPLGSTGHFACDTFLVKPL